MRKRVSDEVVAELIENDGCRKGHVAPINETGIVRLALDLREARAEVARLSSLLSAS